MAARIGLWISAVALAACASAVPARVPENLRGCWIERRVAETITMRWFPSSPIDWRGDLLSYRDGLDPAPQTFLLGAAAGEKERWGWAICQKDDALGHGPPCQPLFFGRGPSSASERMEIVATKDRLRFEFINGDHHLTLFDGARDGCD